MRYITILTIMMVINAFNLIDGIDGLAGATGVIVNSAFATLFIYIHQYELASVCLAMVGALLGFLRYNLTPAKIFMGDTGSLLIGLVSIVMAIEFIEVNSPLRYNANLPHIYSVPALTIAILIGQHLTAGAKQVIISAPPADKSIPTVVLAVNDDKVDLLSPILSNASCTTNNVAAMVKILDENWGITDGYITTVHSMTGDQNLHDAPHKDLRRARAASASIIPTTTGAAKAITAIFPHLEGRLGGAGIRVPVLNGSLTDFTCSLKKMPTVDEINAAFKQAADGPMKNVLEYTEDPIVSTDILDNPHSCIFDAQLTSIVGGLVKVVGWYDNEMGYSSRLADLVEKISLLKK
jgi:hypothetical protein